MWEQASFRHSLQPDFICPMMTCYCETLVPIIKPLRKKTSPQHVYGSCYFCLRLIAPTLKAEAFSGGLPGGQRKGYDECAACYLLRPGFIKLGFNTFFSLSNKAIRTMTYDCAVQWDLQGVKVGAELGSMAEKVVWAILLVGFCCFPPKGTVLSRVPAH